jgi:hypothetical protein
MPRIFFIIAAWFGLHRRGRWRFRRSWLARKARSGAAGGFRACGALSDVLRLGADRRQLCRYAMAGQVYQCRRLAPGHRLAVVLREPLSAQSDRNQRTRRDHADRRSAVAGWLAVFGNRRFQVVQARHDIKSIISAKGELIGSGHRPGYAGSARWLRTNRTLAVGRGWTQNRRYDPAIPRRPLRRSQRP